MRHKYKYYRANNKIICVSTFAGKPVRGVAICSPNDEFDYDKGAELARLKCDAKIAEKRCDRAIRKFAEANIKLNDAENHWKKMKEYLLDSYSAKNKAVYILAKTEKNLNAEI